MKRFASRLVARLRSHVGESLVETLAAVLICTLAVLMLYTAVVTAGRMNMTADASAESQNQALYQAQAQQSADGVHDYREVTVDGFEETFYVEYFGGTDGSTWSYRYAEEVRRWPV